MKYILMFILCINTALAGTAIVCHPDGTCDVIITQDDRSDNNGRY